MEHLKIVSLHSCFHTCQGHYRLTLIALKKLIFCLSDIVEYFFDSNTFNVDQK